MESDDTPRNAPRSPKATPSDSELSRMGREAVRQPPDPRLDRELARMGLTDAPETAQAKPGESKARSVTTDPELERLRRELRRIKVVVWLLAAVTVILAVAVVILLTR
jgi:hypothetical protein